jgi:hypothetical protein
MVVLLELEVLIIWVVEVMTRGGAAIRFREARRG